MSQEANTGSSDREKIEYLPHVGEGSEILTRSAALAAFFILKTQNPHLHDQLHKQLATTQQSIVEQIAELRSESGYYEISEAALRGIVAQGIIAGSVQAATAIGATLKEISLLESEQRDIPDTYPGD